MSPPAPRTQRSPELQRLVAELRSRPRLMAGSVGEARANYEAFARRFHDPPPVRRRAEEADGVRAEWSIPDGGPRTAGAVLFVHGGGFTVGSIAAYRDLSARIADQTGAVVLTIEYRLAPEHVFPAALDDCVTAYRWLTRHLGAAGNEGDGEGRTGSAAEDAAGRWATVESKGGTGAGAGHPAAGGCAAGNEGDGEGETGRAAGGGGARKGAAGRSAETGAGGGRRSAGGRIVIVGDSVGGGLVVSALVTQRDSGGPLPAGAALISPRVDLLQRGASIDVQADHDPLVSAEHGLVNARRYVGPDGDLGHPLASPVYADPHGLPPCYVQVGTAEILLDEALHLARRLRDARVDVELDVWPEGIHILPFFASKVPEGASALRAACQFIQRRLTA